MPDLIYNVKFQIDDSQFQKESAGVERYKQEIEEANAEIAELKVQLGDATVKSKQFVNSNKNVQGSTKRMNASFSSANQTLFSFSDGLQDAAQFQQGFGVGMRAIGNNVGFTAELFGNLSARVKEHNAGLEAQVAAGKMSNQVMEQQSRTLKGELVGALKGPGGVLIAINIVVTAITVLSNHFASNKKKAEEAAEGISQYADAIKTLRGLVTPDVTQLEGLIEEASQLEQVIDLLEERNRLEDRLSGVRAQQVPIGTPGGTTIQISSEQLRELERQEQQLVNTIDNINRQIRLSPIDIGERGIKKLEDALEGIRKNIEDVESSAAGLKLELGLVADVVRNETTLAISKFELGLDNSEQLLKNQIQTIDEQIRNYTNLANSFLITGEQQEIYIELLKALAEQSEAAKNALKELNEEQESDAAQVAAARADREAQAQRDIKLFRAEELSDERARLEAVKQARTDNLEERIQELKEKGEEEALTESEIALERLRIEKEYQDGINDLREESFKREQERKEAELKLIQEQAEARRSALMQGLSDVGVLLNAAFGQDKKTAIASAVVSAYASAQEAYENALKGGMPPPIAKISAVAAFGASMARVQKMRAIQPGSAGGGAGDSGGASGTSVSDASMADRFGRQGTRQRQSTLRGDLLAGQPGYIPSGSQSSGGRMSFRVGLGISGGELTAFINEEGSSQINNRSLQASEVA